MERSRSGSRVPINSGDIPEKPPLMVEQPLLPEEAEEEPISHYLLPSTPEPHYLPPVAPDPFYEPEEPEPAPRAFPPALKAALWVLIDHVRADQTYARNLRVRLATFQGNDVGPLTAILDAMAAPAEGR